MGERDPGGGALGGGLEVLGQAPAAPEPGEGALDHPAPRQQHEAALGSRELDHINYPVMGRCIVSCLLTRVRLVHKRQLNRITRDFLDLVSTTLLDMAGKIKYLQLVQ